MTDTQRIRHIDAWRFIAVSMVIQSHLIIFSNFSFLVATYPFLRSLSRFGDLGVLIFFFISGFVICRGLMQERAAASTVSLKAFYVRRAFRILPPLWLYLAALALLAGVWRSVSVTPAQLGKSALFLCNIDFPGGCSWLAGHTWSLAYEEQFYLVFPLVFMVLGLTVRPKLLLVMLSLMVSASLGLRAVGSDWWAGYLSHMIFMLTGCAAALYWHRLGLICRGLSVRGWLTALTLLAACVGLLPFPIEAYVKTVLYPPLIGLVVLGTPISHPKVRAFFQNPLLAYLGKISYTAYLWQQLATAQYPTISPWWTVLFILAVWLFAHYSYQYFESPLIGIATRWSDDIKQRASFGRVTGFVK